MALIRLDQLEVRYGSLKALDKVSCTIESGAVGLLGPNGAGKSTLLKALLGFVRPSAGTVEMFGHPMPGGRLEVRQRLGYMPERDIVSPKISAVSFLTYCGCLMGMTRVDARERAHEVLNYVGMGESRYRKMETYSTGMCQRVAFAQALIHDPKLLLLDEPTNGLDPEGRIEMLELIRELAVKRGVTVILSSHLMPDVQHVCDRVIVITKGKVVQDGRIADLTVQRDGLFELRVRDNKEAFLAGLEEAGCTWHDQQTRAILVTKPPDLEVRGLFEIARAQGTQIRHLRPVRHSLEEVFMEAIGAGGSEEPDDTDGES
jgi:ABC-2 type transport system ATP-binding protein